MKNTLGKDVPGKSSDGTSKVLPANRASEQVEPVVTGFADVSNDNRLKTVVSVGKKPETYEVAPSEVESLRPSPAEMKNG